MSTKKRIIRRSAQLSTQARGGRLTKSEQNVIASGQGLTVQEFKRRNPHMGVGYFMSCK